MYVCVCRAVNEKTVREACDQGARSIRDLSRETGLARDCGKCAEHAREILHACHRPVEIELVS